MRTREKGRDLTQSCDKNPTPTGYPFLPTKIKTIFGAKLSADLVSILILIISSMCLVL